MDELFGPLNSPFWNLESYDVKFKICFYSSVFFFLRKALPNFDATLPVFFLPFAAAAFVGLSLVSLDAAVSVFSATRLARGAAAAPPRFARLLNAGFNLPSDNVLSPGFSLESKIVT